MYEEYESYIPLIECIDRRFYNFSARNFYYGIFNESEKGFIGIREKWGSRYLFTEYHYDTGAPYGTVKPVRLMNVEIPSDMIVNEDSEELFKWLENQIKEIVKIGGDKANFRPRVR